ncbi:putative tRNAHis guanylyltransferase [Ascodesmis nigricans]|uniref:tRNA(His) guanylyltransferase n=1 Tax=Ascodesmis nigricans TaxID=341454 RepID=A0A4S2N4Z6_9PEZI|nr:putative tRNAHis guanylyltransferase [Ascodesmis nigricans]
MANSQYGYVKSFETPDRLLPNTWIVIRLDGRGFHKFTARHGFEKPNDKRALDLMNACAEAVVTDLPDVIFAYGVSDEYSFVLKRECELFERRESKLVTTIVSHFTAHYIYLWPQYFPSTTLTMPLPTFDGRAVLYPSTENLRDYLSWRQVDAHINNLYNTTFWMLILRGGRTEKEAERELQGTVSGDKNEILFSQFGINYNNEPEIFKKGSCIYREYETSPPTVDAVEPSNDVPEPLPKSAATKKAILARKSAIAPKAAPKELSKSQLARQRKREMKAKVVVRYVDIIKDEFWEQRTWILGN